MPIYDYHCTGCGPFTALRAMSCRDAAAACPACGAASPRTLVAAPGLPLLDDPARRAHATNERSRHAPASARGHRHGPGCGCGQPRARAPAGAAPDLKSFAGKRPWMISH